MFGYMLTIKQMKVTPLAGSYCSYSSFTNVHFIILKMFHIRISIRAGTHFSDLQEVEVIDLNEPTGWIVIPLKDAQEKFVYSFFYSAKH